MRGVALDGLLGLRGLLQRLLGVSDLGLAEGDRLMRVRFLDRLLAPAPGLLDVAVPFGSLDLPDGLLVIVVENKETFLALPQAPDGSGAVIISSPAARARCRANNCADDWVTST